MDNRILVTYATRAGSTAEVAAAIAETLAARGYAVDVKPVKEKPLWIAAKYQTSRLTSPELSPRQATPARCRVSMKQKKGQEER